VTDFPGGEQLPVLELGGGWRAQLLPAHQWHEAVSSGPLQRFADFDPPTRNVYVISKVTPNTEPGEGESGDQGIFVAPCGVPEDTPEALYVALINAQAHEALEWVQIDGSLTSTHTPKWATTYWSGPSRSGWSGKPARGSSWKSSTDSSFPSRRAVRASWPDGTSLSRSWPC
jgi:hypothetical protein